MHQDQIDFCERLKRRFPHWFVVRNVLDCGSLDVNGNNRYLFDNSKYLGIDVFPGNNVDVVTRIHEFNHEPFDTIISTECLEHDEFSELSLAKMIDLLTPNGVLIVTCATVGRPEHGTEECLSYASPGTLAHYRNIEPKEVSQMFSDAFKCWSVEIHHFDLYAWGTDKK